MYVDLGVRCAVEHSSPHTPLHGPTNLKQDKPDKAGTAFPENKARACAAVGRKWSRKAGRIVDAKR